MSFKLGDSVQWIATWIPFHREHAGVPVKRTQKGLVREVLLDGAEVIYWHPYKKQHLTEVIKFRDLCFTEPEQEPEPRTASASRASSSCLLSACSSLLR